VRELRTTGWVVGLLTITAADRNPGRRHVLTWTMHSPSPGERRPPLPCRRHRRVAPAPADGTLAAATR